MSSSRCRPVVVSGGVVSWFGVDGLDPHAVHLEASIDDVVDLGETGGGEEVIHLVCGHGVRNTEEEEEGCQNLVF